MSGVTVIRCVQVAGGGGGMGCWVYVIKMSEFSQNSLHFWWSIWFLPPVFFWPDPSLYNSDHLSQISWKRCVWRSRNILLKYRNLLWYAFHKYAQCFLVLRHYPSFSNFLFFFGFTFLAHFPYLSYFSVNVIISSITQKSRHDWIKT